MKQLPESIRVGYQDIKIITGKFNFEEDHGKYNDDTAEICINTEKHIREVVNTVIHETLHAICHNYALRQTCFRSDDSGEKEEAIVSGIANALTQVFVDNPQLLDWIQENLHTT